MYFMLWIKIISFFMNSSFPLNSVKMSQINTLLDHETILNKFSMLLFWFYYQSLESTIFVDELSFFVVGFLIQMVHVYFKKQFFYSLLVIKKSCIFYSFFYFNYFLFLVRVHFCGVDPLLFLYFSTEIFFPWPSLIFISMQKISLNKSHNICI